ncbi:hypothetical protein IID27_02195 [Patescibacteria group bacterium]|nr:hypothetical protein [Patescibacteria group bacterium]
MQKFSKREALTFGWEITASNFVFFFWLIVLFAAFSFSVAYLGDLFEQQNILLGSLTIFIIAVVGGIILEMGILLITLELYDQKKPHYKDILIPKGYFFRYLIAKIVYGLIVVAGLILLIVPGIIWSLKYAFVRYFIVDKGLSIKEAFSESSKITSGSKWNIFWLSILIAIINILGALAFGVGLLLSIPITIMAYAYVYRKLLEGYTINTVSN